MRAEPFSLGGMPALRWGRPSRRGILYLHGQGGSKAEAAFFAAAAADAGWQTVSVDLPGHGDREAEAGAVSVRSRSEGDIGVMKVEEFLERSLAEVAEKKR